MDTAWRILYEDEDEDEDEDTQIRVRCDDAFYKSDMRRKCDDVWHFDKLAPR
jgi:hypothetical protein